MLKTIKHVDKLKQNLSSWSDIPYSCTGRFIIKMAILPKFIYRSNSIPVKIPPGSDANRKQIVRWHIQTSVY